MSFSCLAQFAAGCLGEVGCCMGQEIARGGKMLIAPLLTTSATGLSLGLCWLRIPVPGAAAKPGQGKSGLLQYQVHCPHLSQPRTSNYAPHSPLHFLAPAVSLPFILWLSPSSDPLQLRQQNSVLPTQLRSLRLALMVFASTTISVSSANLMLPLLTPRQFTEQQRSALRPDKNLQKRLHTRWAGRTIPRGRMNRCSCTQLAGSALQSLG